VVLIVGAMSLLDMRVTIITSSLPLLLFVLMLPYSVYFIERYRERQILDPTSPGRSARSARPPAFSGPACSPARRPWRASWR